MESSTQSSCGCGIGFGSIIAILLSWSVNHSVLWAIFHALCGWFYVIYWLIFYFHK